MDGLIIDDEKSTVYLSDPDMSLDVGAIAKGYAVEAVCSSLEERGIGGYIISVGGNIKTVGPKPGGEDWSVGIENPLAGENENPYIYTLKITGLAVVTSGAYQRYYTVGGVRYHHIINR
jgi:thiamine biosynthesis lipoprotein